MPEGKILDEKVSGLVDKHIDEAGDDPDALFEALEAEDDLAFREARISQLSSELAKVKAAQSTTTGSYISVKNDQDLLDFSTSNERCLVHFSHPDFARCGIMDKHLETLSKRHYDAKFARVDVNLCPFVVEKLGVRILPCVVGFVAGLVKGKITGFEGVVPFGNEAGFVVTKELEKFFVNEGVLERVMFQDDDLEETEERPAEATRKGIQDRKKALTEDDDDDDWD